MARQLRCDDYTVGWVCALPVELAAAQEMLDEEHHDLKRDPNDNDENLYALGSIGRHNVAIVCLPIGRIGNNPASAVSTQMRATFKAIRFGLMVGIGGGVPTAGADVRLGDVVISQPHQTFGGVVQYDVGKATPSGFERTGSLNSPPHILLSAVSKVRANELRGRSKLLEHASKLERIAKFQRVKAGPDVLFEATYDHDRGQTCDQCSVDRQEARQPRESEGEVVVHYGTIASGNQVMRSAAQRDQVSAELGGVLCFEMEAAGLMNSFPCLVIRGICDYADSHKNKRWQAYAAATAAAYAKEVLSVVPAVDVANIRTVEEATRVACKHDSQRPLSPTAKRRKTDGFENLEIDNAHQQNLISASRPLIKQMISTPAQLSPGEQECLRSLAFPEQEHRLSELLVAKDTCKWLSDDVQYRAWKDKPQGLFWVKGDPGAGKSVLMKHAFKNMREENPDSIVIAFFFHGQGVKLQKTPLGLLRALLNLLLEYFPKYLSRLTATFDGRERRHGSYAEHRWEWNEKELQEMLSDVLTKGTQHQPAVVFIDALDECGEHSAKNLLAYFKELITQAECSSGRVKVCLSSRHYPTLDLEIIPAVHVEKRNDKDIRWYTQNRLKSIQPKSKREQLETEILSRAGGGFQWVSLVTETIMDKDLRGIQTKTLLRELESCPETLGELYASILRDVPATEQRQMVKIFQWVLFAGRPLSAQELRDALAIDKDMSCTSVRELRAHEGWSDTLKNFEKYVKYISGGLIQFQSRDLWEQHELHGEDSDREAQLIHQSVADYLTDELGQGVYRLQAGAGHLQISRSCLRYLTLREILEETKSSRGTLSSKFQLAPYAVRYLFEHIQSVEQEKIIQSDLLSALQWTPKSELMQKLEITWRILDPQNTHTPRGWPFAEATSMHVLAAFGSRSAVDHFLTTSDEIDGRDSEGNTPLMLAIREGHQGIALALLNRLGKLEQQYEDHGQTCGEHRSTGHSKNRIVDIDAKNKDGDTALEMALDHEAEEVIYKLIEAGADLKYLGRETALVSHAISSRNIRLLSICIEKKLDLDGSVVFALRDCLPTRDCVLEDIISKLLGAGANTARAQDIGRVPEHEDSDEDFDEDERETDRAYSDDALMIASRLGLTSIVHILLSHGSSATYRNNIGEFPLHST
ncbi:hypothetical protein EJ02DRAFT_515694 [Clathrospora elynae]|uniref:NACHT domain-containing protein n=1 Tax=Clathrospora elynae TaxID=706981 RepID=A0A6A5SDV8_9PLEO|nr:hypothetical protein EJ02DRAFT_515694 [Clathrospora elynae]